MASRLQVPIPGPLGGPVFGGQPNKTRSAAPALALKKESDALLTLRSRRVPAANVLAIGGLARQSSARPEGENSLKIRHPAADFRDPYGTLRQQHFAQEVLPKKAKLSHKTVPI